MRSLSWRGLQAMAAQLVAEIPASDANNATITNALPIIENGNISGSD